MVQQREAKVDLGIATLPEQHIESGQIEAGLQMAFVLAQHVREVFDGPLYLARKRACTGAVDAGRQLGGVFGQHGIDHPQ